MRTLLVDDDPAFRRLAAVALDEAGIEHQSVPSASAALKVLEGADGGFDMLLLDLELPGMRGEELLQHIRKQGHDIPIVLVTVQDLHDVPVSAESCGAVALVRKQDFGPAMLQALWRKHGRSNASKTRV